MFRIETRGQIVEFLLHYKLKKICEIGVFRGDYLLHMLQSNPTECIAVDSWKQENVKKWWKISTAKQVYRIFMNRIRGMKNVKVIKGDSVQVSLLFQDEYFDFVYIDADHSFEGCLNDLVHWTPKVRIGGWVAGHDYDAKTTNSVNLAVHHFMKFNKNNMKNFFVTKEPYTRSFFFQRIR